MWVLFCTDVGAVCVGVFFFFFILIIIIIIIFFFFNKIYLNVLFQKEANAFRIAVSMTGPYIDKKQKRKHAVTTWNLTGQG